MKTKDKVRYWLTKFEHLRDNDYKLCCNIWNQELKEFIKTFILKMLKMLFMKE